MAGIYIHIPFCKSRCIYCGFYSTTQHSRHEGYINAILAEYENRKDYLGDEPISTIYVGGGTPSILAPSLLEKLLIGISRNHQNIEEFTIECNPDDITKDFVSLLKRCNITRVSMGVQSFSTERLHFLRRRHSPSQVFEAVNLLKEGGIENISIDLMFGFPNETIEEWEKDISHALTLNVNHISAYSLMYEENTPLYTMLQKGLVTEISEDVSREMYYLLKDRLEEAGFEHYEISNFAREGFRSKHNSNYWRAVPYLGLGAAAHSYNLKTRGWNVSDIEEYIKSIYSDFTCYEYETLDADTAYNDIITTSLRTCEGLDLNNIGPHKEYLLQCAVPMIKRGLLVMEGNHLHLTRQGLYISDDIMSELMYV